MKKMDRNEMYMALPAPKCNFKNFYSNDVSSTWYSSYKLEFKFLKLHFGAGKVKYFSFLFNELPYTRK